MPKNTVVFFPAPTLQALFEDPDGGGAPLDVSLASQPEGAKAKAAPLPGGGVEFKPEHDAVGVSTFKVAAKDAGGAMSSPLPINIELLGEAPLAARPLACVLVAVAGPA